MSVILVQNVIPSAGSQIGNSTTIAFDIVDTTSLLEQIVLAIDFEGLGLYEVAYDGALSSHYAATCDVTTIANGYHFQLLRDPVWPDSVALHIFAFAADGTALVTEIDWPLKAGQAIIPPPTPAVIPVIYPVTGSAICNATMYDEQHFLDLFDRVFPDDYLAPLKLYPDSGYELFQGMGALGARISQAVERLECDSYVITAAGGVAAGGSVQFFRPNGLAGSVTVKKGSLVTTSAGGRDFVTLEDCAFSSGTGGSSASSSSALGPIDIDVRAITSGYEWNVTGQVITPAGLVIPGEIDTCKALILDPPYGDTTIQVQQLLDTTGGRAPALDGLGADRGILRNYNELDPNYAVRIRSLPDTISPDAIVRNLQQYLPPLGISFSVIEQWDITYQTCYDAPFQAIALDPEYDPNLFAYDDTRSPDKFADRWLDELDDNGAFLVIVAQNNPLYDVSMAFDDPGTVPADFQNVLTGWQRGDSAFDVDTVSASAPVYPACYDGFDLLYAAAMLGLENLFQLIKAGGVAAGIEQNGDYTDGT